MLVEQRLDRAHRDIDPASNFTIGISKPTRIRSSMVEFGRKPCAIGAQRMQLRLDRAGTPFGFAFACNRRLKRIQRLSQPPGCRIHCARIGHGRMTLIKNSFDTRL